MKEIADNATEVYSCNIELLVCASQINTVKWRNAAIPRYIRVYIAKNNG